MDSEELLRAAGTACGVDPSAATTYTTQADPEAIERHLTDHDRAVGAAYACGWNDFLLDQPNCEDGYTGDERDAYVLGARRAEDEYVN